MTLMSKLRDNLDEVLDAIYKVRQYVDFTNIIIALWIIIFISYSHLLLYKKIKYFVEIEHMEAIAEGKLDKKIPEQSN